MKFKKTTFIPLFKLIGSIFFEKKYLCGKYFDNNLTGWKWVIRSIFTQKIIGYNKHIPWPVSPNIRISNKDNIIFDINDINNFQENGNYFQNFKSTIYIGSGTYIAQNVGIITANHNPYDLDGYMEGKEVIIGNKCWIGMNAVILPGVILGDHTIVGASAVVTKSFPEGNVIIAGNPAKVIRKL